MLDIKSYPEGNYRNRNSNIDPAEMCSDSLFFIKKVCKGMFGAFHQFLDEADSRTSP